MPLFNSLQDAGEGIITNADTSTRRYAVEENGATNYYRELDITETRVWVGLTRVAAYNAVIANEQPTNRNIVYSWSMREDQRTIGSYIVERTTQQKSIVPDALDNVPVLNAPTLSPSGYPVVTSESVYPDYITLSLNNISSFPFTVQLRSTTPNTIIEYYWYRWITRTISGSDVEFYVQSDNYFGSAGSNTSASVTFTLPSFSWKVPDTTRRNYHFSLECRTVYIKTDGTRYSSPIKRGLFSKDL